MKKEFIFKTAKVDQLESFIQSLKDLPQLEILSMKAQGCFLDNTGQDVFYFEPVTLNGTSSISQHVFLKERQWPHKIKPNSKATFIVLVQISHELIIRDLQE